MSSNNKRTGKWTAEEEEYAEALSMSFHAGLLRGVEEGTSLRKLLAAKLFCSPKRISKKFEGTSYEGKKTYTRNIKASKEELDRNREHIALLEAKFIASINATPNAESGSPSAQFVGSSNTHSRINVPNARQWNFASQLERTTQLESLACQLAASNTTLSMGSFTQRPELATTTSSFPQSASLPRSGSVAASVTTQVDPSLDLARWLQLRSTGNIYRPNHGPSRPSSLDIDRLLRIQMLRSANVLSTTVPAVGTNAAAGGNLEGLVNASVHGLRIPAGTLNPTVGASRQQWLSSHEAQARLTDQLLQSAAIRSDRVQQNNNAVDSDLSAGQKRPSLDAHDECETPLRKARK